MEGRKEQTVTRRRVELARAWTLLFNLGKQCLLLHKPGFLDDVRFIINVAKRLLKLLEQVGLALSIQSDNILRSRTFSSGI